MCTKSQHCEAGLQTEGAESCPPGNVRDADGEKYYRLVYADPPKAGDFLTRQEEEPLADFGERACKARALSVFKKPLQVQELRKLSSYKGDPSFVAEVKLEHGSGVIRTKSGQGHVSWWRCRAYDPLARCKVVSEC